MRRLRLTVPAITVLALAAAQAEVRLGAAAPEWIVETAGGGRVKLGDHLRRHRREAVILAPRPGESIPRARLEEDAKRLAGREAELVVLPPDQPDGGRERPAALLVDAGGVVRRVETGRVPAGRELEEFLDLWRLGRDVFLSACARCHGDDGSLEICGDVKPLTGIGNRLTSAQVYERLRPGNLGGDQVLIRGRFHQRREVEAVVVFVRGL